MSRFDVLRKKHTGRGPKAPTLYVRLRLAAMIYRELSWEGVDGAQETADLLLEASRRLAIIDRGERV